MQRIAREKKPKMIIAGASAYARIIDFEPFAEVAREIGAKFMVDMAHFAGLVATGYHPSPVPHADAVTSTTHKTLRGPRGGLILCKEEHAKMVDKAMFPGTQGGPLEHIIAAKAVAFKEALDPSFKDYCGQIVRNAQAFANALMEHGFDIVSGGTDNHLMLVDLRNKNVTGKVAEKALDIGGNHRQQEHGTKGDTVTIRHQWHPNRHSCRYYPRDAGAGDGDHRRPYQQSRHQPW